MSCFALTASSQTDTKTYLRILEEKYDGLRVWAILNTEIFLR